MPSSIPAFVISAGDVIVADGRARRRLHRCGGGFGQLRKAEVQHLHGTVGAHLDVRGLQIAMDDPLLVRGFERLGNLLRDRRADIWAFGVVLYEMLVGRRAFEGHSISETLANVLKGDPEWNTLPRGIPPSVHRLLRRCVEKDPRRRLRDIGDAQFELEPHPDVERPASAKPKLAVTWIATATFAMLAAVGWLRPRPGVIDAPPFTLTIVPPARSGLVPVGGQTSAPEISPDGSAVLYATDSGLYVRQLNSLETTPVPGSEDYTNVPFWSADSTAVVFPNMRRELIKVRLPDGAPEVLTHLPSPTRGGSWSDSGTLLVAAGGQLFTVASSGGELKRLPMPELNGAAALFPQFLPGGSDFLFLRWSEAGERETHLGTLSEATLTDTRPLLKLDSVARYTPAGGGRCSSYGVTICMRRD